MCCVSSFPDTQDIVRGVRDYSYGQSRPLSFLDKFGQFLSVRQLNKGTKLLNEFQALADVGSGYSGNITKPIWKKFKIVYLFDFNLDKEKLVSTKASIKCIEGNIMQTTKSNLNPINLIVLNNVLEHVENPTLLLIQLKTNLTHEGILFINVPSWRGKFFLEKAAFVFNLAPKEEMEDHKRYYSKRELWLEIRKAGFLPSDIKIKKSKFGLNITACVRG